MGIEIWKLTPTFLSTCIEGFPRMEQQAGTLNEVNTLSCFFSMKYREYCFFRRTNCNYYLY